MCPRPLTLVPIAIASLVLAADLGCGDDALEADAGAADAAAVSNCPDDLPEFRLGMQATGEQGLVVATIEDASPSPPKKYENDWAVKLTDPDGEPIDGLTLYDVEPFMPEHGHDGTFTPIISPGAEPGQYQIDRINMPMKDLWEVRLFVHVDADRDDKVVFEVCIPP